MRVLMTTGGTRGDVQPYVALGKRLREAGTQVRIATSPHFESLVREAGLDFYPISLDLRQLLDELLTRQSSGPLSQALGLRRHLLPLLETNIREFCEAGQDADALFQTPATFVAYYVARYLGIPSVSAELQPAMHGTSHFRSAILPPLPQAPSPRLARVGNRLSYVLVHEVFWSAFRAPINEVICGLLGMPRAHALPSYTEDNLSAPGAREPVLCGWSPQVLTKPPEWRTDIHVTGYWFLDGHEEWRPPEGLLDFLESGPEPVAIGFGSTTSLDPEGITETITAALRSTGNRAVLLTGWSDLDAVDMPAEIFPLEQAPHDWLFPRVSAAIHHGGSTTTGASLRTGTPAVTIPFWFDQHFWGERVAVLGAGPAPIPARRLTSQNLAEALRIATTNTAVRSRAEEVGRAIRQEDGPSAALHALERHGILL